MERVEGPEESRKNFLWGNLPPLRAFRAKWPLCPHTTSEQWSCWHFISHSEEIEAVVLTLEVMFSPWWLKVSTHPSTYPSSLQMRGRIRPGRVTSSPQDREREREKHPFTVELILESLVYLSCKNLCLDVGSQNTGRESTQTQKEHSTALLCLSTQRSRAHSHVEWDQLFSSLFVDLPAKQRFLACTLVCRVTQTRDGRVYRIKEDHRSGWCKKEKGSEGVCK